MQQVYKELIEADFLAVASPVFFTTVSGYLKALIDRCQRFWSLKYEHKKRIVTKNRKGIFISTAGSGSKDIFNCPKKVIRSLFDVLYVDYLYDFVFNNVDSQGDILKNKKAMEDIYRFGKEKAFLNQ
jgi:FMN-dependent NADH-azoreductase